MYRATIRTTEKIKHASAFNHSAKVVRASHRVQLAVEDIHEIITLHY